MLSRSVWSALVLALVLTTFASPVTAQWLEDGVSITTNFSGMTNNQVVSDGLGGLLMVWQDRAGDFTYPYSHVIRAQRLSPDGSRPWGVGGRLFTNTSSTLNRQRPKIDADGADGAVLVWLENSNLTASYGQVHVARADEFGSKAWESTVSGNSIAYYPQVLADGSGGAIANWVYGGALRIQRFDENGAAAWTSGGVVVASPSSTTDHPMVRDQSGGALVAWSSNQGGEQLSDVFLQRITSTGVADWISEVPVCTALGSQSGIAMVEDGSAGAVLAWTDDRGAALDIYAQRVDAAGNPIWTTDGIPVCTVSGDQSRPRLVASGDGAFYLAWLDQRGFPSVFVQRVDAGGSPQWDVGGIRASSLSHRVSEWQLAPDGVGGCFVSWVDTLGGVQDLWAQRFDADGDRLWAADGVEAAVGGGGFRNLHGIVNNGNQGALLGWRSSIAGWAQFLEHGGYWGVRAPTISAVADVPLDQGGRVHVQWQASPLDVAPGTAIGAYSIWRRVPLLGARGHQAPVPVLDHPTSSEAGAEGLWKVGDTAWEWISELPAMQFPYYAYTMDTNQDSTAAGDAIQEIMVAAHTTDRSAYYSSLVVSGYSVDNLSPAAPQNLVADYRAGQTHLDWSDAAESDFLLFRVYRGTEPGFSPASGTLVQETVSSSWVDPSPAPWGYHYRVSTVDDAGNEGPSTAPVSVTDVTRPDRGPGVALREPVPNPFNPSTTLAFEISRRDRVELAIYDVSGRLVRTLLSEHREPGSYEVRWRGEDESGRTVSSGMYIVRLRTQQGVLTKRMVLLK